MISLCNSNTQYDHIVLNIIVISKGNIQLT